jgi:hypothetical protein
MGEVKQGLRNRVEKGKGRGSRQEVVGLVTDRGSTSEQLVHAHVHTLFFFLFLDRLLVVSLSSGVVFVLVVLLFFVEIV